MERYFILIFSIFLPTFASAQSDSMIINFKNGKHVTVALSDIRKITFDTLESSVPLVKNSAGLEISPSFPNPAIYGATFDFTLASAGSVSILIYDTKGNIIRNLSNLNCSSGQNLIVWDGDDTSGAKVTSGIYFYEVRFKSDVQIRRMVMIK